MNIERLLQFAGTVAVPLLLAALAALGVTWSALADYRARDAVMGERVNRLELAVEQQASSAARIENSVVALRVQQAEFVGEANARIRNLEQEQ